MRHFSSFSLPAELAVEMREEVKRLQALPDDDKDRRRFANNKNNVTVGSYLVACIRWTLESTTNNRQ